MGDRKRNRKQIEKLVDIANDLEKREQELNRKSQYFDELKLKLGDWERRIAAAEAAKAEHALAAREAEGQRAAYREKAVGATPVPQNAQKPVAPPLRAPLAAAAQGAAQSLSAGIVQEINEVVKSVFWDYSSSVQQISSQISTITAATLCAAVTCILENRSFDVRAVFMQEMEKMLRSGVLGKADANPPEAAVRPESGPAPAPRPADPPAPAYKPAPEPQWKPVPEPAIKPAPEPAAYPPAAGPVKQPAPVVPAEPVSGQAPKPAYVPPAKAKPLDADGEDGALPSPADVAAATPRRTGSENLRIASVIEFQKLGDYGFRNDDNIVRVELPEGIQYLPGNFFYGCTNLKEIWLPDSLLEIGAYSFYGCKSLATVHLSEKSALRDIGEYAFAMCESLASFTVPPLTETLGTSVFRFCSALESLSFSKESRLRTIGSHLLHNCTSLDKIHLPDSIKVIPTSMFYGCAKLRKVTAKGADTIEDYAFFGNESLRTVTIRARKAIAPQAFEGCDPALVIEYLNG